MQIKTCLGYIQYIDIGITVHTLGLHLYFKIQIVLSVGICLSVSDDQDQSYPDITFI